jgi:site-specific DNA-methyltransferase (adenine-specific)
MIEISEIKNSIINADSSEYLREFPDDSVDLVVTSPPYDNLRDYDGKTLWNMDVFKSIANQIARILKPGAVCVWVVGDKVEKGKKSLTSYRQALYFDEIGLNVYDVIIYEKAGSGPPHPNRYFNTFEYMFILSKGKPKTVNLLRDKPNKWGGKETYGVVTRREKDGSLTQKGRKKINEYGVRTNIWRYANGKGFSTQDKVAYEHPAIYPEKLVEDHVKTWSNPGDLVLDPFGGSGTTAKIARELGRDWIIIEVSPEYCDIARRRLEEQN